MRYALALFLLLLSTAAYAGERYAITMNDGTVAVMDLVQGTAQEAVDKWTPSQRAKVVSITKVNEADLPTDRTFRNAWTFDKTAKKFGVDMTKAKGLWKEKLLTLRAEKAKQADKEMSDADALGDSVGKAQAQAKKAALNNVIPTAEIDAAQTPEELKAIMPDALKD